MRIQKLEFENLNSLKGKWSVDFTHPDYARNHDIFVIHGPTGSGKTTLLDAITLALYGRTPRLESINNGEGGNEIMTRGTGFCRAAVTYSCKKGIFLSEFMQNRAGMKASGNLQKTSFKISRIDGEKSDFGELFNSDEVVASGSGSTNLEKETQKIIQLDYKQFCRSIMLAQGEFSAFLESNARDRAEILEKLTGTERYRAIGKKIAEKFKEIKTSFALTKKQKEDVESQILSEEDEKQAQKDMSQIEKSLAETEEKLTALQKELVFFDELERLQKEFESAKEKKARVDDEIAEFTVNENRLSLAVSAKNCEAELLSLESLRTAQKNDRNQIELLSNSILGAEHAFEEAKNNALQAGEQLKNEENDLAVQQNIWKKVRELDVKILSARQNLSEATERKNSCESQVSENEKKISVLKTELEQIEKNLGESEEYCLKNKNDEKLDGAIGKIETLKLDFEKHRKAAAEFENTRSLLEKELSETESNLAGYKEELENLDEKIKQFVSADAVFIAKLLRLQLAEGKPCPVCLSPYHSSHEQAEKIDSTAEIDSSKVQKISEASSNLSANREKLVEKINASSVKIESLRTEIKNTSLNLDSHRSGAQESLSKINEILLDWQKSADETNLPLILKELQQKHEAWIQNQALVTSLQGDKSAKNAEVTAVSQNLLSQKEDLQKSLEAFKKSEENLNGLAGERKNLFGEKNCDEEEKLKNQKIVGLKDYAAKVSEAQNLAKEEKARLEAQKTQLEGNCSAREPKLQESEKNFIGKITANGFKNEADFMNARMKDEEFNSLSQESERLKMESERANTSLKNAEKSFAEYKKSAEILRTKDEALAEQKQTHAQKDGQNNALINLKSKLHANEQNKEQAKKILAEYAALQGEYGVWEQMNKWAGQREGADLSVFVQSLAFTSLLNLANKNLFGITGRYNLVQKKADSLEFEISDIYFEKPRSIANLSGGEKFLVSLSFALAISEFASRNVRVDSLFLDEGFGTLSGELLTESINALKNLQKDGKMLGIITHVQDVIDEIEQKIEVKPISLGHSELIGSGIARA